VAAKSPSRRVLQKELYSGISNATASVASVNENDYT
jgi:hypothetical protein